MQFFLFVRFVTESNFFIFFLTFLTEPVPERAQS